MKTLLLILTLAVCAGCSDAGEPTDRPDDFDNDKLIVSSGERCDLITRGGRNLSAPCAAVDNGAWAVHAFGRSWTFRPVGAVPANLYVCASCSDPQWQFANPDSWHVTVLQ